MPPDSFYTGLDETSLSMRIRAALKNQAAIPRPQALGANNEAVLERANLAGTFLAAKFEFLEVIGEGGMALVFKARHPHLDKLVAIKILQASEQSDEAVRRFEREARVISKLDHRNIVTVYDFGVTEKKQPYMVMEFIEGKALDVILEEQDYLALEPALSILLPVCDGIAHAHDHRILHRDLKPGNIMLKQVADQPAIPKVLDFGVAKPLDVDAERLERAVPLTQAQQIIGTPPYISPEAVRGQPLDERSDVYSFGCVIFETVTGYPPFCGDTPLEVIVKRLEEPPLSFQEVRPELTYPQQLAQLIERALAVDPEDRYQSMRALQEELTRILQRCADG